VYEPRGDVEVTSESDNDNGDFASKINKVMGGDVNFSQHRDGVSLQEIP